VWRAGKRFLQVSEGWVAREDVELADPSAFSGVRLTDAQRRSRLAFVRARHGARLYDATGAALDAKRLPVQTLVEDLGAPVTVGDETLYPLTATKSPTRFVRARDLGLIAPVAPPAEVTGERERWIDVNLAEQVLVAYEGSQPVFATLVSSGKGKEFATPTGLFQIREKHISITMSGPDPDHGVYEVGEVPWTLYYHDSYALHGAYWHDDFGQTRSHGCTNIAPADARWLFYWSEGTVPPGWNSIRNLKGTWVYLTDTSDTAT
jgi:lipoprotein-anchoring transpeptidase ErfK/SrfK